MKHLALFAGLLIITSCKGQINLESLKIDEKISFNVSNLHSDIDPIYGLKGYSTDDLSRFKIDNISLRTYQLPDGNVSDYSDVYIFVDNYESSKFLGYMINSVNEEEQKKLMELFQKKYGKPKQVVKKHKSEAMIWIDDVEKKWVLLNQNSFGLTKKETPFKELQLIVVKQGTRVENTSNTKAFTILDSFELSYFSK